MPWTGKHLPPAVLLVLFLFSNLFAGSTGKIAGKVVDAKSKEPLFGVNVLLEGTTMGAATDVEGNYAVLNVPPGIYTLKASSVGYQTVRTTNVKVQVDLTTQINFEVSETSVVGEEVVVVAERPLIQKDLTSTSSKVSSDQIKSFPVEDVSGLVNLQAGVVEGHFRGGRAGEVLYLIDGIPVTDSYSGSAGVTAENHSIQELEVISGTFNAEYGQAMSGVVNQVTKDGAEKFAGEISLYSGDYVSTHKDLFMHVNRMRPTDITNIQGNVSGPLFLPGATFFLSGRHYYNDGFLYGKRIFLPTDSSNFSSNDPSQWYIGRSGDGAYVSMNPDERLTAQAKLTFRLPNTDLIRLQLMDQRRTWREYDHPYKYNPDGTYHHRGHGLMGSLSYTTLFSATSFLELHGAWFSNREDSFVYEDPYDPRFPDYRRALATGGAAFLTGGARDLQLHRESRYLTGKADYVSQVTKEHQIKVGVEGKKHRVWIHNFGIQNDQSTNFKPRPVEVGRSEFANALIRPEQASAYIQDKMEFEDLIVNAGIRFDYFRAKAKVLAQPLTLSASKQLRPVKPEYQLSPRLGLAFPITDRGVLHLSYGHFFQVPNFDLLYLNPGFNLNATLPFQVGNPDLKSERTVAYEVGVQQQLSDDIGLDVTAYYKDVRNLVGTEIFDIGNGNKYSQFVNRDYGNTRGFILSLEKRHTGLFGMTIDYTFQIAKGNASDPSSVFLDNLTSPPRESQKQLAPLDWDRRHSLNVSATVGMTGSYIVTIIGRLASGLPYTPAFQNQRTGLLNSENRPSIVNVDVYVTKFINLFGYDLNLYAKIYNLFDSLNELDVFTDSGRAGYSLQARYEGQPRGINTIDEYYQRPDFYSAPRQLVAGVGVSF